MPLKRMQRGKRSKRPFRRIRDQAADAVLAGEEHLVGALVGDLLEGDRQAADDQSDGGKDEEGPWLGLLLGRPPIRKIR